MNFYRHFKNVYDALRIQAGWVCSSEFINSLCFFPHTERISSHKCVYSEFIVGVKNAEIANCRDTMLVIPDTIL